MNVFCMCLYKIRIKRLRICKVFKLLFLCLAQCRDVLKNCLISNLYLCPGEKSETLKIFLRNIIDKHSKNFRIYQIGHTNIRVHIVSPTFNSMRLFYRFALLFCRYNYFELAEQSGFKIREICVINEMSSNNVSYALSAFINTKFTHLAIGHFNGYANNVMSLLFTVTQHRHLAARRTFANK